MLTTTITRKWFRSLFNRRSSNPFVLVTTPNIQNRTSSNIDVGNDYIVKSPFPDIPTDGNFMSIAKFVSQNWSTSNYKDKVAIVDGGTGQHRTYQQYLQTMMSLATNFPSSESTTVALISANHVDYVPIVMAMALLEHKLTPINPYFTDTELQTILQQSQSTIVICHIDTLPTVRNAIQHNPKIQHVIIIPDANTDTNATDVDGTISLSSLITMDTNNDRLELEEPTRDFSKVPFLLPYSSGTTGMPKGVLLSHDNLISNLWQFHAVESPHLHFNHKVISPLPFFHIYGFLVSALYNAWQGHTLLTMNQFNLHLFCQMIQQEKPNRAHIVPPILLELVKHSQELQQLYDLSSLKICLSAAAPLSKDVEDAIFSMYGCQIKQAWGMSELSPIATMTSDDTIQSGSVGQLVPNTYGKIIDPHSNKSLPPNQSGELLIKGPQVMMGYYNEVEKTKECLSDDGWLKSGDVAHYDDNGFFYITDRIKELIKVKGYQVAPAELEALLLTHSNISDAAVVKVVNSLGEEQPRAHVVVTTTTITKADIADWVKERVVHYKRLTGGVVFTDKIPKSPSGKILRRLLVDQSPQQQ